jgi:UDP-N-acetylmuramate dehydrogenase
MLLTKDIDALVIHIDLKGKEILKQDDDCVWVEAQAGENWHEFVLWTIAQDFGGLENMSLIPGNVGTTPVQNIRRTVPKSKIPSFLPGDAHRNPTAACFYLTECAFGYRESIFKNEVKGQYIITSVVFKLSRRNHKINTSYGDIQAELAKNGIQPS